MKSVIIRDFELSLSTLLGSLFIIIVLIVGSVWALQPKNRAQAISCVAGPEFKIAHPDSTPGNSSKKADALLEEKTRDIFKANRDLKKDRKTSLESKIQQTIKSRKNILLQEMRTNPDGALRQVLSDSELNESQSLTQNCVEKPETIEGTLEIVHTHLENKGSVDTYILTTTNNERVYIHPAKKENAKITPGKHLKIKGYRLDNDLLVDASDKESITFARKSNYPWQTSIAEAATNDTVGPQPTIVLMAYFQNTAKPSLTKASVDNTIFTNMNNYYQEASYTQMSINGSSVDWMQVPMDQTCDLNSVVYGFRSMVISAADPSVNFTNYKRIIIVANFGSAACGWGGVGTVGKTYVSTADGTVNASISWLDTSSMGASTHEFGHNLGLYHAGFYNCGSVTLNLNGCAWDEYGDLFSPMGSGSTAHFNAAEKEYLEWIAPANIQTVTTNGNYTIEPLETTPSGLKSIKVQRGNGTAAEYDFTYYEYRTATGSDSNLNSNVFTGSLLHNFTDSYTLLLDATPPGNKTSPAMPVGGSFTDPATATKVTVNSKTPTALTLNVELGKTDFSVPSLTFTSPAYGATVSGNVTTTATASAPSGIQKVEFYLDSAVTPSFTDTTAPFNFQFDTTALSDGYHYVDAIATDKSGESYSVPGNMSDWATLLLRVSNDPFAPEVSITSPSGGSTVSGTSVNINSNASDNVSISKVEFYIDNILKSTDTTSPYAYTWDSTTASEGNHTITAKAYDPAGNVASSNPVIVTVYNIIVADTLTSSQTLSPNELLKSANGQYRAVMQTDGNLVVYNSSNKALWSTVTAGYAGTRLSMQTDGNLVLYSSANKPLWNSVTNGMNYRAVMQDDGNFVIYNASNKPLWSWMSGKIISNTLDSSQALTSGEILKSANGQYRAVMQTDGNLVVYNSSNKALWSTVTAGYAGTKALMQGDGNLVLYSISNKPIWNSVTSGSSGAILIMQTDGNLVIYGISNKPLWSWMSGKL